MGGSSFLSSNVRNPMNTHRVKTHRPPEYSSVGFELGRRVYHQPGAASTRERRYEPAPADGARQITVDGLLVEKHKILKP
jgi:hypothetical protein